jgi:hypothetical protein
MLLGIAAGVLAFWSGYYGNHQLVSVTIRSLHLAGLALGGGAGLWTDWQILRTVRGVQGDRESVLKLLSRAHAYVVPWMIVLGATGLLMTAADTSTFLVSNVFWIKMSMVFLLACNGIALILLENRARQFGIMAVWPKLIIVSSISGLLWLTTLFAGTLLTVAA